MKYLSVAEIAKKWNLTDRSVRKYCQDGNGCVGRLIMFKECLKHNITPFIIDEQHKMFYYRGLKEWNNKKGFLRDTVLSCQDKFYEIPKYFRLDNVMDL